MQVFEAGGVAQPHSHLPEPANREPVAGREPDVLVIEPVEERNPLRTVRVSKEQLVLERRRGTERVSLRDK